MELKNKVPVDVSQQFIDQLDAISDAEKSTTILSEKDFPERKFPIRYNPKKVDKWGTGTHEWDEKEIKQFYEDPENLARTLYCPQVNIDELDDWGMFGFTPGFIYIEKRNYKGQRTLADKAAGFGLSVAKDHKTGLSVIPHFDYFPKHKYDYQLIRLSEYPAVFKIMCDIFSKKKIETSVEKPLLNDGQNED
jgi:hypothetical protein